MLSDNYRDLFELYKEGVIVERRSRIIYMNASAKRILRCDPENLDIETVFPGFLLEYDGRQFSSTVDIENVSYMVSVTKLGDDTVFTLFSPPGSDEIKEKLNSLLAGVTGNLRSALSVLQLSADMLKPHLESTEDEKLIRYSAMLSHSTYLAARTTENIEFLRKMNSGEQNKNSTAFDIALMCRDVCDSVSGLFRNTGREFDFKCSSDSILFAGDKDKIENLLLNLLSNAIKYTPENGKVAVSLSETASGVVLSVYDNGVGISPDIAGTAFRRFAEKGEDDTETGLGIGLAIVDYVAKLHGGGAVLESSEKSGTKVTVRLCSDDISVFKNETDEYMLNDPRPILTVLSNVLTYEAYLPKYTD